MDSGNAEKDDYLTFKENAESCEDWLNECEELLKQMEEDMDSDKKERLYERFHEQYIEFHNEFKGLKPSIDRIFSNKKLMKILE